MTLKAYACALAALVALRLIYNAILIAAIGISPVPWRSFFFVALIAIVIGSCGLAIRLLPRLSKWPSILASTIIISVIGTLPLYLSISRDAPSAYTTLKFVSVGLIGWVASGFAAAWVGWLPQWKHAK